jgi:pimeloyl-ACP methyl ester carboxylesterase
LTQPDEQNVFGSGFVDLDDHHGEIYEDEQEARRRLEEEYPELPLSIVFDVNDDSSEGLVKLAEGTRDIAVCISGFGSARTPPTRWNIVNEITGYTTFVLRYDAQLLPWTEGEAPRTLGQLIEVGDELRMRWTKARLSAMGISRYLSRWIRRWTDAGRRVLVVGFSLGGLIAWKACQESSSPLVNLILISAAVGDVPGAWDGAESIGRIVNVYSKRDMVLKHIYPRGVGSDETPAAGLGPIATRLQNIDGIDATDMIGRDHMWASKNVSRLTKMAITHLWGGTGIVDGPAFVSTEEDVSLNLEAYSRLIRWTCADPYLWASLGQAVQGDPDAVSYCFALDRWAMAYGRMETLLTLGRASSVLTKVEYGRNTAKRSIRQLSGLLRLWMASGMGDAPDVGVVDPEEFRGISLSGGSSVPLIVGSSGTL